jgi:formate hydrogenlyase subunit 4
MTELAHFGGATLVVAVQLVVVVAGGLLLLGVMRKTRSRLEGRVGPPVRQPLLDVVKLMSKQRVRPSSASPVFVAGPVVLVATALFVAGTGPLVTSDPPLSKSTDFFAVVFILLLGSVALALAALDTGTPFAGMGASRAMTIGALTEPALLVAVLALSVPAHTSNLPALVREGLSDPQVIASPGRILALCAFVVVIIAETGRLPVDNPSTHLELTMIHEAMVLEYSGPDLALVTVGESTRLALLLGLLVNLFVPWGIASGRGAVELAFGSAALAAKVGAAAIAIATFEVFTAKLRLFRLPELLAGAFVLGLLGVVTALVVR